MVNKDHDENGQDGDNKWYRAIIVRAAQGDKRAKKLQKIVEDSLKDKQEISRLKGDLRDRSTELAYYVSKQAGEQAAMPWEIFSRAQKSVESSVEHYLSILNEIGPGEFPWGISLQAVHGTYSGTAHSDLLKDLAQLMWWIVGRQTGMLIDLLFRSEENVDAAKERLVRSMVHAAMTNAEWSGGFQSAFDIPHASLSRTAYLDRIAELAYYMWSYSGQRGGSTMLDFWSDAEKHISLLTASALKTASSTVDTATRLAGALALFSPRAHLDRIQVSAYHMWEKAGRPYGHALKHWLQAEEAELSGLRIAAQDR